MTPEKDFVDCPCDLPKRKKSHGEGSYCVFTKSGAQGKIKITRCFKGVAAAKKDAQRQYDNARSKTFAVQVWHVD